MALKPLRNRVRIWDMSRICPGEALNRSKYNVGRGICPTQNEGVHLWTYMAEYSSTMQTYLRQNPNGVARLRHPKR